MPSDPTAHGSPVSIPDYRLLTRIGAGNYGDVWLAQGLTGIYRAIKIVWKSRFPNPEPYEREFQGLRRFAAISLSEPRQMALLHIGQNLKEGFFYYVMELADDLLRGREISPENYIPLTLRELRKTRGHAPAAECIHIGIELARAIGSLHSHKLVHRDIKPSNIIIVSGAPKLADIGLVKPYGEDGSFVGTEGFLPPEGAGMPNADVYGLGKVLYELATGLDRNQFPTLPDDLRGRSDRKDLLELNAILLKACDPNPQRRYATATQLLEELQLLQAGKSVRRLHATERSLARALRVAAVLGAVATAGLTGAFLENKRAQEAEELMRYTSTLSQIKDAIQRGDFRSARSQSSEYAANAPSRFLDTFEWRAITQLGQGDPALVLSPSGPPVDSLLIVPHSQSLVAHRSRSHLEIFDLASHSLQQTVDDVYDLAGLDPTGQFALGLDRSYHLAKWDLQNGGAKETSAHPSTPYLIGVDAQGTVHSFLRSSPFQLLAWQPESDSLTQKPLEMLDDSWDVFDAVCNSQGHVLISWVQQTTEQASFKLTLITPDRTVTSDCSALPSGLGFDSLGPWVTLRISGEELRPSPSGIFQKTSTLLSPETLSRLPLSPESEITAHNTQLTWFENSAPSLTASGHSGRILSLAKLSDSPNSPIVSGSESGEIRLWLPDDIRHSQQSLETWDSHTTSTSFIFLPDNKSAVVTTGANSCSIIDLETLTPRFSNLPLQVPLTATADHIYGYSNSGLVQIPIDDPQNPFVFGDQIPDIYKAVFSDDTSQYLAIERNGRAWMGKTLEAPTSFDTSLPYAYFSAFDSTGERIFLLTGDRKLSSWKTDPLEELWSVEFNTLAPSFALNSESDQLYLLTGDGTLEVRSSSTGELLSRTSPGVATPQHLQYDPKRERLFIAGGTHGIQVFSTKPLRHLCTIPFLFETEIQYLQLSSDAAYLGVVEKSGHTHFKHVPILNDEF